MDLFVVYFTWSNFQKNTDLFVVHLTWSNFQKALIYL